MVMSSPADELAASHPLAADAAAARGSSQPPVSNPESLFDDLGGRAAYAAAAGATGWSSHQYPPYARTATTSGGFISSPSPSEMLYRSAADTFYPPPTMAETPPYCWYHQTQPGFPPRFAPLHSPFAQGVVPPPVLRPMQITRAEPSYYHPQTQVAVASGSAADAAAVVHAVPDTPKAQEATAPAPRRRGRPRKTDAAAPAAPKPVIKKPTKRATVRSSRAAAPQPTTSSVAGSATMACQVQVHQQQDQAAGSAVQGQVQHPDQEASAVAVATSDQQITAPCTTTNPMALLIGQKQWQLLQPITCSNDLSARDRAAAAGPYADTSVAGVRFQPTDEELIFYLRLKHAGHKMPVDFFKDFDVYHEHPETSRAACGVVNGCWYAFSPRNRKYKNGDRPARSVVDASGVQVGYWKSNTKLAPVLAGGKADGALVGVVTSLTFHLGRQPKGTQTPWKMKEYSIPQNQHAPDGSAMRLNDWVVCKLFYKERVIKKKAAAAAAEEDPLSEAGENDGWPEGDEVTWMGSAVQTLGNSEQDLCVQDSHQIGTDADDYSSLWM